MLCKKKKFESISTSKTNKWLFLTASKQQPPKQTGDTGILNTTVTWIGGSQPLVPTTWVLKEYCCNWELQDCKGPSGKEVPGLQPYRDLTCRFHSAGHIYGSLMSGPEGRCRPRKRILSVFSPCVSFGEMTLFETAQILTAGVGGEGRTHPSTIVEDHSVNLQLSILAV